jgi:hypothetical protein
LFANVSRGFHRIFGTTKITVLLAFTAAGYNVERARSFRAIGSIGIVARRKSPAS